PGSGPELHSDYRAIQSQAALELFKLWGRAPPRRRATDSLRVRQLGVALFAPVASRKRVGPGLVRYWAVVVALGGRAWLARRGGRALPPVGPRPNLALLRGVRHCHAVAPIRGHEVRDRSDTP